ncbi:MAG: membrane dipeptidase [Clostridia bacterium]|nr:membrane dipeptidase [Clostridia bacterium]
MLADLHCDTFYKCFADGTDFTSPSLHVSLDKCLGLLPCIQTFAHYIPEHVSDKFDFFCRMLDNSLRIIQEHDRLLLYRKKSDIQKAEREGKVLAVLSVEGGSFFDESRTENLKKAVYLEQNHIRFLSLCYNGGSPLCAGAQSKTDSGLTRPGLQTASMLCEHGIAMDVSHLSHNSAMDILNTDLPALATHSNCFSLCGSPRNLKDGAIMRLIEKNSLMGINLYAPFIKRGGHASVSDLYGHIEYVRALCGEHILALGADFDGCDSFPEGINDIGDIKMLDIPHELFYNNVKRFLNSL